MIRKRLVEERLRPRSATAHYGLERLRGVFYGGYVGLTGDQRGIQAACVRGYVRIQGYIFRLFYVKHRCCTVAPSIRSPYRFFPFCSKRYVSDGCRQTGDEAQSYHASSAAPSSSSALLFRAASDCGSVSALPIPTHLSVPRPRRTYPTICSKRSSSSSLSTTSSYGANSLIMSCTVDIFRG